MIADTTCAVLRAWCCAPAGPAGFPIGRRRRFLNRKPIKQYIDEKRKLDSPRRSPPGGDRREREVTQSAKSRGPVERLSLRESL